VKNCPPVIQSGDSDNNTLRPALVGYSEESSPGKHNTPPPHFSKSPEQSENVYENKGSP
jgi:hypothetical protein